MKNLKLNLNLMLNNNLNISNESSEQRVAASQDFHGTPDYRIEVQIF